MSLRTCASSIYAFASPSCQVEKQLQVDPFLLVEQTAHGAQLIHFVAKLMRFGCRLCQHATLLDHDFGFDPRVGSKQVLKFTHGVVHALGVNVNLDQEVGLAQLNPLLLNLLEQPILTLTL